MDDPVTHMRPNPSSQRDRTAPANRPVKAKTDNEPRTIDFSVMLTRPDGSPQKETSPPSWVQIAQMATSQDFQSLIAQLREMSEKEDLTLARACEIALDVGLDADKNEGIKPKLQRGNLIEKINKSVEEGKSLLLKSEDVTTIKNRVGAVMHQASLARQIVLLIDPAMAED